MRKLWKGIRSVDLRVAIALVYTAAALVVLDRFFLPSRVTAWLRKGGEIGAAAGLKAGIIWAAASTALYLVVPLLLLIAVHRQKPSAAGFRLSGFRIHGLVYLALYAVMLPFILMAAGRPDFLSTYPFVHAAREDLDAFIRWEIAYVIQFFALEAFFRGYLLFTLERRFGWNAVFVMAVPYCLIHGHKPPLEQFGSIVAGVALGFLALRFRSFYGGALLHVMVAVTMDVLSVRKAGLF